MIAENVVDPVRRKAAGEVSEASAAPRIAVLCGFHYDVAYLKSCAEYLPECFRILDEAIRILKADPDYRFLVEQVFLLEQYWRERPDQRADLRRLAREGRLEVAPGMYVMPDLNLPSGEALFRQVEYGLAWLDEHLGIRPQTCWIADCWGHPGQLPQILRQCGYSHYVFWRCMRPEVRLTSFRWQGLDGTVLPAHWMPFGYGTLRFPSTEEAVNALDLKLRAATPDAIRTMVGRLHRYSGDETPLLVNGGDMAYPQATAPEALRSLNASGENLGLAFTGLYEFLSGIDWEKKPLIEGEFNSALQGTFTSNIRIKQRDRELTTRLVATEALAAVLGRPLATDPWPLLLKQQFHDIICGTICDQALADAEREFDLVGNMINHAIEELSDPCGERAFFNPLPFERREWVETPEGPAEVSLPPFGFASARPVECVSREEALPLTFQADSYAAVIGRVGYVTGLVPGGSKREIVVPEPAPFGSLAMQIDHGDLWVPFDAPLSGGSMESALTRNLPDPYDRSEPEELVNRSTIQPRITDVRILDSPPGTLRIEQCGILQFWRLSLAFTTRIFFRRDSRRIEFQTEILPAGRNYRLRVAFPTAISNGRQRHEVIFGIQERGAGEHAAQHWADLGDASGGLAVLNRGTPGHAAHDGILLVSLFRSVAMEYKTESAASYGEGVPQRFHYAIVPHGPDEDDLLVREGQAFNFAPLPCRIPAEKSGPSGWRVDGATVSALRTVGGNIFLRLYNPLSRPMTARIGFPEAIARMAAADAFGKPVADFHPCLQTVEIPLRPSEITGLAFQ